MKLTINKTQNKEELKNLINWFINNYGSIRTAKILDSLKKLGFKNSTLAGISLGINDLLVPFSKKILFQNASSLLIKNKNRYKKGKINSFLYSEKILSIWNTTNEELKKDIIKNFRESNLINPLYIMILSGARGNISQVKQLVGMRGLMSDSKGQIINLPIKNNFKEGLNLTEYFISCYGARKGLVDTALKTANSGYLTRRLIYVAQDQIIKKPDCKTLYKQAILNLKSNKKEYKRNKENLIGRIVAINIHEGNTKKILISAGQEICHYNINKVLRVKKIYIRSPLTCQLNTGICQLCYGWNLGNGRLVELGETVGIIAAQSIGEPGTQLTMRTFHTGGIFSSELNQTVNCPHSGKLEFQLNSIDKIVKNKYGENCILTSKPKTIKIYENNFNISKIKLPSNSLIFGKPNQKVHYKQPIAEIKNQKKIKQTKTNKLKEVKTTFSGIIHITKNKKNSMVFISSSNLIQYQLFFANYKKTEKKKYGLNIKTKKKLKRKKEFLIIKSNAAEFILTKNLNEKNFLKKNKNKNQHNNNFHYVLQINIKKQKELVTNRYLTEKYITSKKYKLKTGEFKTNWLKNHSLVIIQRRRKNLLIRKVAANPINLKSRLNTKNLTIKKNNILYYIYHEQVKTKDIVQGLPKVDQILEARKSVDSEILKENIHHKLKKLFDNLKKKYSYGQAIRISIERIQKLLVNQIQSIYQSQGVAISNKHIEVIVKQMTCKVIIKDQKNSPILTGEILELNKVEILNKKFNQTLDYEPMIIGISKLSLINKSFISAASFQETSKILTKAAIEGKIDWLHGLKENVILTKLIPAGTGYKLI